MNSMQNSSIFDLTNGEISRECLDKVYALGDEFYVKVFYLYVEHFEPTNEQIDNLLKSINDLKNADFRTLVEEYVSGTELSYVNFAVMLIFSKVELTRKNLIEHFEKQSLFHYINFVLEIHDMVTIDTTRALIPIFNLLPIQKRKEMLDILNLLNLLAIQKQIGNINLEYIKKCLEKGETTPVIAHLNNLHFKTIFSFGAYQEVPVMANCFTEGVHTIEKFNGDVYEYYDAFLDAIYMLRNDRLALDNFLKVLSQQQNYSFNRNEWLKVFLKVMPIVYKRASKKCDEEVLFSRIKKLVEFDNSEIDVMLSSLEYSLSDLFKVFNDNEFVVQKVEEANLLELYKEYVEPSPVSDYEKVMDFYEVFLRHQGQEIFDKVLGQCFNQLSDRGIVNATPNTKIKVYVAPRSEN